MILFEYALRRAAHIFRRIVDWHDHRDLDQSILHFAVHYFQKALALTKGKLKNSHFAVLSI